jgi:hypothetical protein
VRTADDCQKCQSHGERDKNCPKPVSNDSYSPIVLQIASRRFKLMMPRFRPKPDASHSTRYATCADICENFARDLKPLYLLAFLLTRNHSSAEQCFLATLENCVRANAVFKGWEGSWTKRCLIANAVRLVFSESTESAREEDSWNELAVQSATLRTISEVARLAQPLSRFVFVMSVLERYSEHECALLLGRSSRDVIEARINALRQLSGFDPTLKKTAEGD